MNYSKISVRYSKALFELAKEKNLIEEVRSDIKLIYESFSVPEFSILLNSPIVKNSVKFEILKKVFSNKLNSLTFSFLKMIVDNKRENHLNDISRNFLDFYKKDKGIKSAVFTTAADIDNNLLTSIKKVIKEVFNSEIELEHIIQEDILGGFVLRVEDQQIDSSVSSKLRTLKRNLINTSFEIKLPNLKNN
ncbi:MAG: ATP synthase F1 subunit delta [Bacteroidetes bacterium GWA2_30_7]|nr:MAG: ATP synthase F1 subunit delta [Bacteroidetes bacterium GWA2_30_7]